MFGFENKDNKNRSSFKLEDVVQDEKEFKKLKEHVAKKKFMVEKIIREGNNKEDFGKFGVLLHGYSALKKVLDRQKTIKTTN